MADDDFSYASMRAELLYDKKTGLFRRILYDTIAFYKDKPIGAVGKEGYVKVNLFGKVYLGHRLAWYYVHKRWPKNTIDHIDGNKSNNAISNLREATYSENLQNQKKSHAGSASGLLGAHAAYDGKWVARISLRRKSHYLGRFDTPEQAHEAYLFAKRKIHKFGTL